MPNFKTEMVLRAARGTPPLDIDEEMELRELILELLELEIVTNYDQVTSALRQRLYARLPDLPGPNEIGEDFDQALREATLAYGARVSL